MSPVRLWRFRSSVALKDASSHSGLEIENWQKGEPNAGAQLSSARGRRLMGRVGWWREDARKWRCWAALRIGSHRFLPRSGPERASPRVAHRKFSALPFCYSCVTSLPRCCRTCNAGRARWRWCSSPCSKSIVTNGERSGFVEVLILLL
jgi:hypothetical protein